MHAVSLPGDGGDKECRGWGASPWLQCLKRVDVSQAVTSKQLVGGVMVFCGVKCSTPLLYYTVCLGLYQGEPHACMRVCTVHACTCICMYTCVYSVC